MNQNWKVAPQAMTQGRAPLTLVVMAAGASRRFGRLKQTEPLGPNGETILEFGIHDAISAGFSRVVFVIRRAIEAEFRLALNPAVHSLVEVNYAYQDGPRTLGAPRRDKPWGTAHAVLVASRDFANQPFGVVNADDFYGPKSFQILARQLQGDSHSSALVAFELQNTLSKSGTVTRGVCTVDADNNLIDVDETFEIHRADTGEVISEEGGRRRIFKGNEPVSMNMWAFRPDMSKAIEIGWEDFLSRNASSSTAEYFIPHAVTSAIRAGKASVAVVSTPEQWCGLTHESDTASVRQRLRQLTDSGTYSQPLWADAHELDRRIT